MYLIVRFINRNFRFLKSPSHGTFPVSSSTCPARKTESVSGVVYVESGPDALDGASLACPASYAFDRLQPTVTAEGYCTFAKG
jgi:hypothetical protein